MLNNIIRFLLLLSHFLLIRILEIFLGRVVLSLSAPLCPQSPLSWMLFLSFQHTSFFKILGSL